jgi:hypothetical protein
MSDDMVPRARLNEEIARRKELEADHTALKATLTAAEAKAAEADALRAQLASATAEHETFRVGVEAGITDAEGLDLARYFYDKVQPPRVKSAPASRTTWASSSRTRPRAPRPSARTSPTPPPRPAPAPASAPQAAPGKPGAPQAAAPVAPAPAAPIAPQRTAAPLPGLHTGATPAPSPAPAAGGLSHAQIAGMSPEQFRANQAQLYTEAGQAIKSMFGR